MIKKEYLTDHADAAGIEYYLCGPPLMIKACTGMLAEFGVSADHISYDEF